MKTTVMFVADTIPLGGVPVRLADGGDDEVLVTDAEGKIELDLELGTHTFRVQVDDEWVERTVHRQGQAPLFVVNVQQDERSVSTLNTLQIDLANFVGDRYVFETVLGRGGMGVVVKAIDRMLNRPVAIKMLSDELRENEEAQQIFLVEARNLATLSHPNLVAIHDILNVGGRVLMVFEYVLGENVEKTIKKAGRINQREVLKIAIQLTRCVAYLHEHELIHRDLKPANIIMQADGTLKLIDFGLARSLNELYVRGTRVRGTPAYMAPEQIQGIHLTTATDIYQLGISMYEMLVGKLPFTSGDMAYAHVHLDAPPLQEALGDIDPELARLVHACLEKKPKDRPGSATVLLEQLQQIYARLASGDSQAFDVFERSHSGPLPAIAHMSGDSLASLSSAPEEVELPASEDLSFADEVVGGSNRGLAVMAVIGIAALAFAGWMLTRSDEAAAPADVSNATGAIAAAPQTAEAIEELPTEPEPPQADEDKPVVAARGLVGLGLETARGSATSIASAESDPAPTPRRTVRRSRPTPKPKARPTPTPTPEPEPVKVEAPTEPAEKVAAKVVKSDKKPPSKTAKPKSNLKSAEDNKSGGLLSVDEESDNSLLPVGN